MLDFLFDANYWREGAQFLINTHQAGVNMIPQMGWRQAIEAWTSDKIGR